MVVPELPSSELVSETLTVGSGSSFAIVTVAVTGLPSGAPVELVSVTWNVSSGSNLASPSTASGMFADSEPAGMVTDEPLEV